MASRQVELMDLALGASASASGAPQHAWRAQPAEQALARAVHTGGKVLKSGRAIALLSIVRGISRADLLHW